MWKKKNKRIFSNILMLFKFFVQNVPALFCTNILIIRIRLCMAFKYCINRIFPYQPKMVLIRLAILKLKVHIIVFLVIAVLVWIKYGPMTIGLMRQYMISVKRSPLDNFTQWIINQSKGFMRKCIKRVK